MAASADQCITDVAVIEHVGPEVVRAGDHSLLTQMILDLEAQLVEPVAGWP